MPEEDTKTQQDESSSSDEQTAVLDNDKVSVNPAELPRADTLSKEPAGGENSDLNLNMILDIPVDIRVELGNTKLSISEVLKLGSGAIIELDRLAGSPADIVVNGKMIGEGDIVVVNDNFGIRITNLVTPEERLESL